MFFFFFSSVSCCVCLLFFSLIMFSCCVALSFELIMCVADVSHTRMTSALNRDTYIAHKHASFCTWNYHFWYFCVCYNIFHAIYRGFDKKKTLLTVLLPRFFIRQLRYAVLPTSAVTFLDADISKYGPRFNGLLTMRLSSSNRPLKLRLSLMTSTCIWEFSLLPPLW